MQIENNQQVEISETRATRLAQFWASGDWRYHSHFALIGRVECVDGVWKPVDPPFDGADDQGEVYGNPVGELFHCFKCGSAIQYHFAIEDKKSGRIVNLGMECIDHIDGSKAIEKSVAIVKGLESLKRKIKTDFIRDIHHKQLLKFLKDNLQVLAEPRKKSVAERLEKNPEHYWLSPSYKVTKNGKEFEIKRTKWERTVNAEKDMNDELLYWESFVEEFERRYWNPKTMRPEIEKKIKNNGFDIVVPKLRKLTNKEKVKLNQQIFIEVEEFEKRIKNATK